MEIPIAERSQALFDGGFYCAESVLLAVAEVQGIQSELIPGIATGFCSGTARSGGMCGAVSGAILGIGLARGRRSPDVPVDGTYTLVGELLDRFEGWFGSLNCMELTGCNLSTAEGQEKFKREDQVRKCREYVGQAAQIAADLVGP